MDHGRFSALSCQRIHIAGLYTDIGILSVTRRRHCFIYHLLCFFADPLHICSQKSIHAGDADHDHGRPLPKARSQLTDRFRNTSQMPACDQIRLVHRQIEEPVLIALHGADGGCVSPAAAGGYDQHDRSRYRQSRPLDAKSFSSGRVKSQRSRRTVDQMGGRHHILRDIIFSQFPQFPYCITCCSAHSLLHQLPEASCARSFFASSRKHLLT